MAQRVSEPCSCRTLGVRQTSRDEPTDTNHQNALRNISKTKYKQSIWSRVQVGWTVAEPLLCTKLTKSARALLFTPDQQTETITKRSWERPPKQYICWTGEQSVYKMAVSQQEVHSRSFVPSCSYTAGRRNCELICLRLMEATSARDPKAFKPMFRTPVYNMAVRIVSLQYNNKKQTKNCSPSFLLWKGKAKRWYSWERVCGQWGFNNKRGNRSQRKRIWKKTDETAEKTTQRCPPAGVHVIAFLPKLFWWFNETNHLFPPRDLDSQG